MAKNSVIARERKREKLVAKYATLREQLKKEGNYEALDKLPRNSAPERLHNRCMLTSSERLYAPIWPMSRDVP